MEPTCGPTSLWVWCAWWCCACCRLWPPYFLVLWTKRRAVDTAHGQPDPLQHDIHVQQTYGFLYRSYR